MNFKLGNHWTRLHKTCSGALYEPTKWFYEIKIYDNTVCSEFKRSENFGPFRSFSHFCQNQNFFFALKKQRIGFLLLFYHSGILLRPPQIYLSKKNFKIFLMTSYVKIQFFRKICVGGGRFEILISAVGLEIFRVSWIDWQMPFLAHAKILDGPAELGLGRKIGSNKGQVNVTNTLGRLRKLQNSGFWLQKWKEWRKLG